MTCNILTFNNGAGLVTDACLIRDLLLSYPEVNIDPLVCYLNFSSPIKAEIGIWLQNYHYHQLELHDINIFVINEDWYDYKLSDLKMFNYVICKSKYIYDQLYSHCNAVHLPFFSMDMNDDTVIRQDKFLHFAGRSQQKNTELIINCGLPVTIISENHSGILSASDLKIMLNKCNIHICCSLYESWGHYLFEGLSTGAEIICSDIPVFRENLDPELVHFIPTSKTPYSDISYEYVTNNVNGLYSLRECFYIDEKILIDKIYNFIGSSASNRRKAMFCNIMNKNKKRWVNFFKTL